MFHPVSTVYHRAGRYREVANVLARHGFGYILDQSGLRGLASVPFRHLPWVASSKGHTLSAPQRLRQAIEELGPTAVKLGQFLSTRPDILPPEFIRELETLQDAVPPFPFEQVCTQIQAELGRPVEEVFAHLSPEPIAAASLAQVHQARLHSGEEVVVKVQRPGIEEGIKVDLATIGGLAALLEQRTEWARLWGLVDIVDEISQTLHDELDFASEGSNADAIRHNCADDPGVHIPRVYWNLTSHRVLTLERLTGVKIGDRRGLSARGLDHRLIARSFARTILRQMLVDGVFHADPHPGNVLVGAHGEITLMDFGMVGELDDEMRANLVSLVNALVQRDVQGMSRVLLTLCTWQVRVDERQLRRDFGRLLRRYYRIPLREIPLGQVLNETMSLARKHRVRLPSDLMLLAKALVTMEGTMASLDPDLSIVDVAEPFGRDFLAQRFSTRRLHSMMASLVEANDLALGLPRRVANLLDMLEQGQLTVQTASARERGLWPEREAQTNRLALAILVAAGSIGAALLLQLPSGPHLFGMPVLGLGGLLTTLLLGIWLVLSILRSGRL